MITDCIDEGYRQFTNPPLLPNEMNAYDWSFMKPMATWTLGIGSNQVRLPDDFGGIEGAIVLQDQAGDWLLSARIGNPEVVASKQNAFSTTTGPPEEFAVLWQYGTSDTGQRAMLICFPMADQNYTLQTQYYVLQDALSGAKPYPWGGMLHSSTILASCLAVVEYKMMSQRGPAWERFMERLGASASADRRMKPQTGGYNADRSDSFWRNRQSSEILNLGTAIVTYSGQGSPPFGQ